MLASPCPMWVGWGREMWVFPNHACLQLIGRAWAESAGRPGPEVWGRAWDSCRQSVETVLVRGGTATVTMSLPDRAAAPCGEDRPWHLSVLADGEGAPAGVLGVLAAADPSGGALAGAGGSAAEVDRPVEAGAAKSGSASPGALAAALEEERARFRGVFDQGSFAALVAPDGCVIEINRVWLAASGVREDEVIGRPFWHQPWWDSAEATEAWVKIAFGEAAQGSRFRGETGFRAADGSLRRLECDLAPVHLASGSLRFVVVTALDVTDRHRSSEELRASELARESEARFRRMADAAPVFIWTGDAEHRATWFNQQWLNFVGRPLERELGYGWLESLHPDDVERTRRIVRERFSARLPLEIEFRLRRHDGEFRWVLNHGEPMFGHNGEFAGYIGSCIDITERKRAELAIQRLAAIVESSGDAILAVDLDGYVTNWNRGAEVLYGFRAEEIIGQPISAIIPPECREEDATLIRRIGEGASFDHVETRRLRRDGSIVYVSVAMSPIRDETGAVIGVSRIARDISERIRIEAELRRREQLYRAIGESISYGVWVADASGQMVYVSESLSQLVGARLEDQKGLGWTGFVHPDDVAATVETWTACLHDGTQWEREHRFRDREGHWHPVLSRGVPVRDESGRITSWVGINLDISRLKQKEEALRESEERFRTLADNIAQFAWTADAHGRIFWFNRRWFEYVGHRAGTADEDWRSVYHPDHIERVVAKFARCIAEGRVWEDTFPLRRHDGVYRWFLSRAVPIRDEGGRVVRWFGTNTDITERREFEQKLERARDEALAASRAKDDFLAALSHELRTPLNPVLLLASDAADDPELPSEVRADFATIRKHVSLEARLIDDLLDLTRISRGMLSLDFDEYDLHAIVRDALATVAGDVAEKSIVLTVHFDHATPRVRADVVRLQQALWNVLKNAVKFTPVGGRIHVATRLTGDGWVEIGVSDSGIGINPEEIARIFEAFAQGDHASDNAAHRFGGLGLGLTISRRVVEMHGGRIEASSPGPGRGSRFALVLPVAAGGKPAGRPRGRLEPERHDNAYEGRRVLLVEDHTPTRVALKRLLVRRGFEVVAADTATEAIGILREMPVDLLVSDIGLPDGNGCDIMRECARLRQVPGIALTGYGMEQDHTRSREAGFSAHLTKPVTTQSLDRAIAQAMAGSKARRP